jgi:hypothetical protein
VNFEAMYSSSATDSYSAVEFEAMYSSSSRDIQTTD